MVTIKAPDGRRVPVDPGVYVDGCRGVYASVTVVELAQTFGYVLSEDDAAVVAAYRSDAYSDVDDAMRGIVDDATDHLNAVTAGGFWDWHDGDFRLDADECEGHESARGESVYCDGSCVSGYEHV